MCVCVGGVGGGVPHGGSGCGFDTQAHRQRVRHRQEVGQLAGASNTQLAQCAMTVLCESGWLAQTSVGHSVSLEAFASALAMPEFVGPLIHAVVFVGTRHSCCTSSSYQGLGGYSSW